MAVQGWETLGEGHDDTYRRLTFQRLGGAALLLKETEVFGMEAYRRSRSWFFIGDGVPLAVDHNYISRDRPGD